MPKSREKGRTGKAANTPMTEIAVSAAMGSALVLAVLAVFAFIMSVQDIPGSLTVPIATLALAAGAVLAGYRCGRRLRRNGIANGALTGGLIFLVFTAISLAIPKNEIGLLALYKCLLMVVGGALGCVAAVNRRSKIKPPHTKRR